MQAAGVLHLPGSPETSLLDFSSHTRASVSACHNMRVVQSSSATQGLGATVMFCGGGINHLTALRADIKYAVAASDASVAASLTTPCRSHHAWLGNVVTMQHPCAYLLRVRLQLDKGVFAS